MAEHLVKTLCHIVFILKLYSKFLLGLFHCPAYLQLAPLTEELCSSGNAADYQWSIGIMGQMCIRDSRKHICFEFVLPRIVRRTEIAALDG